MPTKELMEESIYDIYKLPGNDSCADCFSSEIYFANCKIGIFLCKKCGESHRLINEDPEALKTVYQKGGYTAQDIAQLQKVGNMNSQKDLEASLPAFYRRPWDQSPPCIRDEFIAAKYLRFEFQAGNEHMQKEYTKNHKRETLLKRLRDDNKFVKRYFELSINENYLRYYTKPDYKDPYKASLDLERMNATFVNETDFRVPKNTLLLTFQKADETRNLFVYSDNRRAIIEWYNAIRCGKMHRLCLSLTGMGQQFEISELASTITYDFSVWGWLEKTGPRPRDAYRKRWCVLARRRLLYYPDPVAPYAKGDIYVGPRQNGFNVSLDTPENWKKHPGFVFTLTTPERPYVFATDSAEHRNRWLEALKTILDSPMTLDEDKEVAGLYKKRSSSFDVLKKM